MTDQPIPLRMVPEADLLAARERIAALEATLSLVCTSGRKLERVHAQNIAAWKRCQQMFDMMAKVPGKRHAKLRGETLDAIKASVADFAGCGLDEPIDWDAIEGRAAHA